MFSGLYPIAASRPHTELGWWLLATTKEKSIRRYARDVTVPPLSDPAPIPAGFRLFHTHCVPCHGAPANRHRPGTGTARPLSDDRHRTVEYAGTVLVLQYRDKDGRDAAWSASSDDWDSWAIVAFLCRLPAMSPAQYQRMLAEARLEPRHLEE